MKEHEYNIFTRSNGPLVELVVAQNCGLSMVYSVSTFGVMCGDVSPLFWLVRRTPCIVVSKHRTVEFLVFKRTLIGQQMKAITTKLNIDALFHTLFRGLFEY